MKKLLALLLCLLLVVSCFAGCGDSESSPISQAIDGNNSAEEPAPTETETPEPPETTAPTEAETEPTEAVTSAPAAPANGSTDPEALIGTWELAMPVMDLYGDDPAELAETFGSFHSDIVIKGMNLTFDGTNLHANCDLGIFMGGFIDFIDDYMTYLADGGIYDMLATDGMTKEMIDASLAASGTSIDELLDAMRETLNGEALGEAMAEALAGSDSETDENGNLVSDVEYTAENGVITTEKAGVTASFGKFVISEDGNTLYIDNDGVNMAFVRKN